MCQPLLDENVKIPCYCPFKLIKNQMLLPFKITGLPFAPEISQRWMNAGGEGVKEAQDVNAAPIHLQQIK
jgi:hypothetical protein